MFEKSNWFSNIIRDESNKLMKDYVLPVTVDLDSDYKPTLIEFMNKLHAKLVCNNSTVRYALIVEQYKDFFNRILNAQYSGDLDLALEISKGLLDDLNADDEAIAFSKIKYSIAFHDMIDVLYGGLDLYIDDETSNDDENESTIQFFRARVSETYTKYSRTEMLHVPFNKRQFISNERFSISGFPCLYLGTSSYCCWLEMGTPDSHRFNVSYVEVNENNKILNLTVNAYDFEHCVDLDVNEGKTITMFKLWLMTVATSFNVREKGRIFKSEYVISQMIMLTTKKLGYYGVSYYSKRVVNDCFADHVCTNLAIFALYSFESSVSDVCRDVKLTNSMNFELFKNLQGSLKYKEAYLNVTNSRYPVMIGDFERQYPYNETEFYDFDKYLVAHLREELQAVNLNEANRI